MQTQTEPSVIGIAGHEGDTTTSLVYTGVKLDNLDKPFMEVGDIKAKIKVAEEQIEMKPMEGKFTGTMVLTPGICLMSDNWIRSLPSPYHRKVIFISSFLLSP